MTTGSISGPVPKGWASWGVDLSQHNQLSPEHWTWLAANGASFAFCRVSRGLTRDALFATHATEALRVGMRLGAYLYLDPDTPPLAQVRFALREAKTRQATMGQKVWAWAVDIEGREWTEADRPGRKAALACTQLLALTGRRPYLYTYPWFFKTHLKNNPVLDAFPLWAAWYPLARNVSYSLATPAGQFGRPVAMWQYGGGWVTGDPADPKISKSVT